jgi:3-hydroxyisobutyrate dehydrogenase-like beta-hydroxyacid dehydrogenase
MRGVPAMKLGFIGLGKMGRPMTGHLLRAGQDVVIHNRSRAVVDELAGQGASPATSPDEVARAADIVFTCLPTPESVEEVYFAESGLIPAVREGQVLVDFSTVSPELSRRQYAAAKERQASFLDAPISGGTAGAENATLTIMVGGDAEALEKARPAFEILGQNIHHVGPSGAGSVVKLVNQLLVAINMAGVAEAIVFGVKAGADPKALHEVLSTSFGGSAMLNRAMPLVMERKFDPGTPVNLILKDVGLIMDVGKELDTRLVLGAIAGEVFKESRALGNGEEDMVALVKAAERLAGIEVRARS